MAWKAKQPRAKVPVCWICDRMLYAGGKSYAIVKDEAGNDRPAHKQCAKEQEWRP